MNKLYFAVAATLVLLSNCGKADVNPPLSANDGGMGGGAPTGGGVGGGMQNTRSCGDRCLAKTGSCGLGAEQASTVCSEVCARSPTQEQISCIERSTCKPGDVKACLESGAGGGGGSQGTGGGGSASGGGQGGGGDPGGTNPCPIPAEALAVTFPYFEKSIGTLVEVGGFPNPTCIQSVNGKTYRGYSMASVTQVFETVAPFPADENLANILYSANFRFARRALTAAELLQVRSATGIPSGVVLRQVELVSRTPSKVSPNVATVGWNLPEKVEAQWFMPSASDQPANVAFLATVGETQTLAQVKEKLDTVKNAFKNGAMVRLAVVPLSSPGNSSYELTATLKNKVGVEKIERK
jgi:hypothetical protein